MVVGEQRAQRACEVGRVDAGDEARVPQQLAPVDLVRVRTRAGARVRARARAVGTLTLIPTLRY